MSDTLTDDAPAFVPDRRAEIALELEHLDLYDRFVAAKANEATDPEEYRAAKAAFSEHRTFWRQIGEAVGNRTPGAHADISSAAAHPTSINATTEG